MRRPALDRHELGDREPQSLDLLVDELRWNLDLRGGNLEGGPVGDLDLWLHVDGGREAEVALGVLGQLVVVLRLRDRTNASSGQRAAEPTADVALDRLRVQPLAADPRDQHRHRHLTLAKAGNLDRG